MIDRKILILSLIIVGVIIICFFLPSETASIVQYGTAVVLPLSFGLIFPYIRYFTGNNYLRTNTEINFIDSYVNRDEKTVYMYNSIYRINDEQFELKFELDHLRKIGSKLQIFVLKKDYNEAKLADDVYHSMVTSFVAGIVMIPMMAYAIYLLRK